MKSNIALAGLTLRASQILLMFLYSVLVARYLDAPSFGRYAYSLAWLTVLGSALQMGLPAAITRDVSVHLEKCKRGAAIKEVGEARSTIFAYSVMASFPLIFISYFAPNSNLSAGLVFIGLPLMFAFPQMMLNEAATRGFGQVIRGQLCQTLFRPLAQVGFLVLAIVLLGKNRSPATAMGVMSISALISFYVSRRIATRNFGPPQGKLSPRYKIRWREPISTLSAINTINALAATGGTLLLGLEGASKEVAQFVVAQQLAGLLSTGLLVVSAVHAPKFASTFSVGDKVVLQRLTKAACRFSLAIAAPAFIIFFAYPRQMIEILYGPGFSGAAAALAILAVGQLLNAAFGPVGLLLISTHNEKYVFRWQLVSTMLQFVMSAILITQYGAVGAAIGTTMALVFWNSVLFWTVRLKVGVSCFPF